MSLKWNIVSENDPALDSSLEQSVMACSPLVYGSRENILFENERAGDDIPQENIDVWASPGMQSLEIFM